LDEAEKEKEKQYTQINFKVYLGDLSLIALPFYNYSPKDELHTFPSIYAYINLPKITMHS
jgi:hypothetical protein